MKKTNWKIVVLAILFSWGFGETYAIHNFWFQVPLLLIQFTVFYSCLTTQEWLN